MRRIWLGTLEETRIAFSTMSGNRLEGSVAADAAVIPLFLTPSVEAEWREDKDANAQCTTEMPEKAIRFCDPLYVVAPRPERGKHARPLGAEAVRLLTPAAITSLTRR